MANLPVSCINAHQSQMRLADVHHPASILQPYNLYHPASNIIEEPETIVNSQPVI
jgi:hypothetical protein